jgi:hypothetical protein
MSRKKMSKILSDLETQANRAYLSGSVPMMLCQWRYAEKMASQCDELHYRALAKEARSIMRDLQICMASPPYRPSL